MVIMTTSENKKGFSGLTNMGNTCYMNSVFQCLSSDINFIIQLLSLDVNKYLGNDYNDLLSCFHKLIDGLWRENRIIRPTSMKRSINFNFEKYDNKHHHDANEFFYDFLEALRISTSERYVSVDVLDVSSSHYRNSVKEWRSILKDKKSIISDQFYGQYKKRYTCTVCSKINYKYDLFSSLILDLSSKPNETLESLLNLHFKEDCVKLKCDCNEDTVDTDNESEDGVWEDHGKEEHRVDTDLLRLPETLVITINRYSERNAKKAIPVEISKELDFSEYLVTNTNESVKYTLSSIICHKGNTLEYGHYYAFVERNGGYIFNDNKVYKSPFESLDTTEPYMLFYKKIGSKKDT